MIHTSFWRPRVYPYLGDGVPTEIDRVQDLSTTVTLNREKIREVGRDGIVDWRKRIPSVRVSLRQFEYGNIEFWRKVTNAEDNDNDIVLNDFKTAMIDIVGYKTDDDGTFTGCVWYPKLRTSSFNINIGDPQASVERSFEFAGEDENILQGTSQYFNYQRFVAVGGAPEAIAIDDPAPVADPDLSGQYLFRVVRYTPSTKTTTELVYSTSVSTTIYYTFSAPSTLSCATTADDIIRVYYAAATFNTNSQSAVFTNNDGDPGTLVADSCSIYLYDSSNHYVYRLQSVSIDVSFDRADYYEIGDEDIIQRGINDKTVRITLGRMIEAYTIEEVLRNKSADYGKLNTRKYEDDSTLRIYIYENADKTTFKMGYKFTGLSPVSFDTGTAVNTYANRNAVVEGENCLISALSASIDA